ncbi:hypothetical protein [Mycoplasma phocoeninasale]|uniref:Uncharacterized protein n=1 Tax=Mycoplasma phocoeninasale TaxID=2726117 RepID=A0A858U266_9MOLU|nr:hypothetical protein [Mycoplasma phocoeninasale]MBN0970963.1 hypothetical protein [Mycoplasma phocoeninasale]QJG66502.1 hypothetical protein HGG64_02190 [Mycoplasma phocoeninasale]
MKIILDKKIKKENSIIAASFWLTILFFVFLAGNIAMTILFLSSNSAIGEFFVKNPIAIIFIILLLVNLIAILVLTAIKYQAAKKANNLQLKKYYLLTFSLILVLVWFIPFIMGTLISKEIVAQKIQESIQKQ